MFDIRERQKFLKTYPFYTLKPRKDLHHFIFTVINSLQMMKTRWEGLQYHIRYLWECCGKNTSHTNWSFPQEGLRGGLRNLSSISLARVNIGSLSVPRVDRTCCRYCLCNYIKIYVFLDTMDWICWKPHRCYCQEVK